MSTDEEVPTQSNASQSVDTIRDLHRINAEEAKIRAFLVAWIALIMTLILIIFAITRDTSVLAVITVFAAALTLVFTYYFRRR